jgi:hypothetical protein
VNGRRRLTRVARRSWPALLLLALLPARPAAAWPASVMESLARDARRLLPRSLAALMHHHEKAILEEAQRFPPELSQLMTADLVAGELQPETLAALEQYAHDTADLLRQRRVTEGVIKLGALLRIPADLADPVLVAGGGGYPAGVTREYYAFVEASLAKIPVVLEDPKALRLKSDRLAPYWRGLHTRSRDHSGVILLEMFRNGRVVDHRTIDYRSPVFGVASLAYSRAVTSIAATWLALWRSVGGDVTLMPVPTTLQPRAPLGPSHVPVIPPAGPARGGARGRPSP